MPLVKREHIKVHREYGKKPVLESTKYYKEKKPKVSKTPRMSAAISEYKHQERMRKMEEKLARAKAKEKRQKEWERKKKDIARRTGGFWGDVSGKPQKKAAPSQQKTKYVVVGGKAYPVHRKKKPKKKKKDMGGSLMDDLNEMTKDFGW